MLKKESGSHKENNINGTKEHFATKQCSMFRRVMCLGHDLYSFIALYVMTMFLILSKNDVVLVNVMTICYSDSPKMISYSY